MQIQAERQSLPSKGLHSEGRGPHTKWSSKDVRVSDGRYPHWSVVKSRESEVDLAKGRKDDWLRPSEKRF